MSHSPEQPEFNPFTAPAVVPVTKAARSELDLTHYRTVHRGLQLIYYSAAALVILTILIAVSFGLIGVSSVGSGSGAGGGAEMTFGIVMALFGIGFLISGIVSLVGLCMCAACPNPNEKRLALTSVICIFGYLGISVLSSLTAVLFGSGASFAILNFAGSILGNVAYVVGTIAFCLLLKRIGNNISSSQMKKSSHSAMVWFILLSVISVLGLLLIMAIAWYSIGSRAGPGPGQGITMFMIPYAVAVIVLALGTLFQFLAMLRTGINELKPRSHA